MSITRQHSKTEIFEIYGKACQQLIAVVEEENINHVYYFYLFTGNIWHRFTLDAGLLFWDENVSPDQEEDISNGEIYRNVGVEFGLLDKPFNKIKMENNKLCISVDDGSFFEVVDFNLNSEVFIKSYYI